MCKRYLLGRRERHPALHVRHILTVAGGYPPHSRPYHEEYDAVEGFEYSFHVGLLTPSELMIKCLQRHRYYHKAQHRLHVTELLMELNIQMLRNPRRFL